MGLWTDSHAATIDRERFRAHNQYLEQAPTYPYRSMVEHVRNVLVRLGAAPVCPRAWMLYLEEDGGFGCESAEVDGWRVSRDLLDSLVEIAFIEDCLKFSDLWNPNRALRVLDIGAGYGRLAHRLSEAYPRQDVEITCTDAIDVSLEICREYLAFRSVEGVHVESFDALAGRREHPFDLAVNIHSWSECSREEIRRWLDLLDRGDGRPVPHLFIVPHDGPDFAAYEDGRPSYLPDLEAHGWTLTRSWKGPDCWPRFFAMFDRRKP